MQDPPASRMTLWVAVAGQTLRTVEVKGRVQIREGAVTSLGESDADRGVVTVETVERMDGAIAVVFVEDMAGFSVALNGVPLGLGLYPIRSTDRLDIGQDSYWLADDLGDRPDQGSWRPPVPRPRKSLDELSHFLSRQRAAALRRASSRPLDGGPDRCAPCRLAAVEPVRRLARLYGRPRCPAG